jgi:hypothetical protein
VLGLVEKERSGCRSGDEVEWWLTACFNFSVAVFFRFFPVVGWCCFCLGVLWFGWCPGSGGGGGGGLFFLVWSFVLARSKGWSM